MKIRNLQVRRGGTLDFMISLYNAFHKRLAVTLGEGEGGYDEEGRFCLVYHPQRE